MKKEKVIDAIGWFLLGLWLISTITQIYIREGTTIFWFCNLAVFVLAIACFQRSSFLVYSILAPALIFQLPWALDWLVSTFTNIIFLNLKSFYENTPFFVMILLTLRHLSIIPLSLILLLMMKPEKPSKKKGYLAVLASLLIFLISYFILPEADNVNCTHKSCIPILEMNGIVYLIAWIIFSISASCLLLLGAYKTHKIIYSKINKQK